MKSLLLAAGLALSIASHAADIAYMAAPPAAQFLRDDNSGLMDSAFGAGNWDRLVFGDSFAGYGALYIDSAPDDTEYMMLPYLAANVPALESYVRSGGRLLLNAATTGPATEFGMGFGAMSHRGDARYYSYTGYLAATGAPLSVDGAGLVWEGDLFAFNSVSAPASFQSLVIGDNGQPLLVSSRYGAGFVILGGLAPVAFTYGVNGGSNATQLRVNELRLLASAVPDAPAWALMLAGLALCEFRKRLRPTGRASLLLCQQHTGFGEVRGL